MEKFNTKSISNINRGALCNFSFRADDQIYKTFVKHLYIPYSYLISRVSNFAIFAIVKKLRNYSLAKFESQKILINMINNDMYSLCIDLNNKVFTGKLHFASCQVSSIKVICKDFT